MTQLTEERKQEIIAEVLAARANREQFLLEMKQRQQAGLKIAQKCASLLKEKYGVTKVVLFGSLLNYEEITPHSDLDLAVWD
ncbi:MAG: nucleotidyltransferase domain-containing protein, partial [Microcystis sp. M20BS1]